jgi:hypothetical protein
VGLFFSAVSVILQILEAPAMRLMIEFTDVDNCRAASALNAPGEALSAAWLHRNYIVLLAFCGIDSYCDSQVPDLIFMRCDLSA